MDEPVRWVPKAEATEELEVSLSTLDRMIGRRDVEVRREGRRVFVRMHGPEHLSDEELLRRAIIMEEEFKRTVRELEQSASELQHGASELERERDEARESVSASRQAYAKLEEAYRKETAAHKETKQLFTMLRVTAVVLLVICGLLTWQLFT